MARKNGGWFKHYNDASDGFTIQSLLSLKDYEGVCTYWALLELVSKGVGRMDGKHTGQITITWPLFAKVLNMKPSRTKRAINRIRAVSHLEVTENPDRTVTFLVCNWLKFQDSRSKNGGNHFSKMSGRSIDPRYIDNRSKRETPDPRSTPKPTTAVAVAPKSNLDIKTLVGIYIESWRKAYGVNARPDMSGKSIGILQRLAKHRNADELGELLQVYCQMKNDWYRTKRHDLVTFEANLNDIVLAHAKGEEKLVSRGAEEINWKNVFGGENATGNLQGTNRTIKNPVEK